MIKSLHCVVILLALSLAGCASAPYSLDGQAMPSSGAIIAGAIATAPPARIEVVPDITSDQQIITLRYATNRKPSAPFDPSRPYLNQRDTRLHRGVAKVLIPKAHKRGSQGGWNEPPVEFLGASPSGEAAFWRSAKDYLASLPKDQQHIVLFVHGYNTDFIRGAKTAGQVWADMGMAGMPAYFSWPSMAEMTLGPYVVDMAAADASEKYLAQYITELHANGGPDAKVHVVAHSMGNRLMLRVANRLAAQGRWKSALGQVILVAPDVDQELFADLATAYPAIAKRTTVLVSTSDVPVTFAQLLNGFPRVGAPPPVQQIPDIDTVEVIIKRGVFGLGHSFHAEHVKVIDEMKALLTTGQPSQHRVRRADGSMHITVSR